MLGALLLISHALYNQMLSIDQLEEHHNDHLDLKIFSNFLPFTKTALKFREDLIKIFIRLAIHQPFINFGDYW